jgi:hypothetical protein
MSNVFVSIFSPVYLASAALPRLIAPAGRS